MNINSNDFGNVIHKVIYNKALKASLNGYVSQDNEIIFDYLTDYDYNFKMNNIMSLSGFHKIKDKDEIKTFINATNWVSSTLLSDKEPRIEPIPSYEIIRKVQKGQWAANCFAHAVVLNDVFCLLGYKSKYVFCLPIDYHYTDNHVVNLVYSKQWNKWFLFDAAQNLYYTDDNGTILDIGELRRHFIEEKPVNVELLEVYWRDLGHKERIMFQNKIMVYMMKNLYRFQCYQNSFLDRIATCREIIHYNLVPTNYMETPFVRTFYDMKTATKHKEIYSSDEEKFWEVPKERDAG